MVRHLTRNTILRNTVELASTLGVDAAAILNDIALDPALALQPGAFVPSEKVIDAVESAALRSGRRDFGLLLGSQNDHRTLGPVGVLAEHCSTVAEAVAEGSRFLHLHNSALLYSLTRSGRSQYMFRAQVATRGRYEPRHYIECLLTMFVRYCRLLLGPGWHPTSVHFEHERLADRITYQRFFRCPVKFNQDENAALAPVADFERKIERADPRIKEVTMRLLQELEREQAQNFTDRVALLARVLLPRGRASAEEVARLMSLSPRTFQRRLAEHDTTFKDILTRIRIELVHAYLDRDGIGLHEMSEILGLSEPSAVSRFLKETFGEGARALRHRQRVQHSRRRAAHSVSETIS